MKRTFRLIAELQQIGFARLRKSARPSRLRRGLYEASESSLPMMRMFSVVSRTVMLLVDLSTKRLGRRSAGCASELDGLATVGSAFDKTFLN